MIEEHTCKTYDGVPIVLGLRVIDYDMKPGVVVREPDFRELDDSVCWPEPGHNGHWWEVCPDRPGHTHYYRQNAGGNLLCRGSSFDGSRLTTKGVGA